MTQEQLNIISTLVSQKTQELEALKVSLKITTDGFQSDSDRIEIITKDLKNQLTQKDIQIADLQKQLDGSKNPVITP